MRLTKLLVETANVEIAMARYDETTIEKNIVRILRHSVAATSGIRGVRPVFTPCVRGDVYRRQRYSTPCVCCSQVVHGSIDSLYNPGCSMQHVCVMVCV